MSQSVQVSLRGENFTFTQQDRLIPGCSPVDQAHLMEKLIDNFLGIGIAQCECEEGGR